MAGFDRIKPIVTADRTGSLARFDLPTGRSRYFFYETQGNYKIAKRTRILHKKNEKKEIIMLTMMMMTIIIIIIITIIIKLKCKNNESTKKTNKQTKTRGPSNEP